MERTAFSVPVAGGEIVGWVVGDGPPVLLLHGGPTGYDYLEGLAAEMLPGYTVAAYQQRGTAPSTVAGPFDMKTEADDAGAVMDFLGWDGAYLVGHSLGGCYALQLCVRIPDRVLGAVIVDPLGAVGDGGLREFWYTQLSRLTPEGRARIAEIDLLEKDGTATDDDLLESEHLIWPTYFADSGHITPFAMRTNFATHAAIQAEVFRDMPALAQSLRDCAIPMRFVHGTKSPMPVSASIDTLALLPNAALDLAADAGHFVWFEVPGSVRMSLDRLVAQTQSGQSAA